MSSLRHSLKVEMMGYLVDYIELHHFLAKGCLQKKSSVYPSPFKSRKICYTFYVFQEPWILKLCLVLTTINISSQIDKHISFLDLPFHINNLLCISLYRKEIGNINLTPPPPKKKQGEKLKSYKILKKDEKDDEDWRMKVEFWWQIYPHLFSISTSFWLYPHLFEYIYILRYYIHILSSISTSVVISSWIIWHLISTPSPPSWDNVPTYGLFQ